MILSTGSPLIDEALTTATTRFATRYSEMSLASISGGTDLNGCFVAEALASGRSGRNPRPGLGMAVQVYDPDGQAVLNEMGELVCEQAFHVMPLGFGGTMRGNPNTEVRIEKFPGVWHHGDFMMFTEEGGFESLVEAMRR